MVLHLIPMAIAAVIAAAVAGAIYVAYLTITTVRNYLRNKRTAKIAQDAVITRELLTSGKTRVIAGFFDGEKISDSQVWEAESVDEHLKQIGDGEVVIVR